MRASWQILTVAVLVIVMGGALMLQRQATGELRDMIGLLHDRNQERGRLQEERSRLVKAQLSPVELERLRSDHAAVERLRAEIEAAKSRIIEMERMEAAGAASR